jgi:hypothetical protein
MVDERNAHRILMKKPFRNWLPGTVLRSWEGNVRIDPEETGCEGAKLRNAAGGHSKSKHWCNQF